MVTKTGEKLRGRKRPKSVLAKAWATRRAKAAKLRDTKASSSGTIHGYQRTPSPERASTTPETKIRGLTKRGRKAAKARTSPKKTARRSELTKSFMVMANGAADAMYRHKETEVAKVTHDEAFVIDVMNLARKSDGKVKITEMLHRFISNERWVAQTDQQRFDRSERIDNAICELFAAAEITRQTRHPRSPFLVSASTMNAVLDVLALQGYSATGKNRPVSKAG